MKAIRAILNGKKANNPELRQAIQAIRQTGVDYQVRVTWETGDMARLIKEAVQDGLKRVVVAGGDGSINEAVNSLQAIAPNLRPELAILPMGTANDFACANLIPVNLQQAVRFSIEGQAHIVDSVRANDKYFMNIATAGFGAEVTAETPVELKNFLGGGAYTLTGVIKALGFKPYSGTLFTDKGALQGQILVGAFCNGRQAGGGQVLAPNAYINDGLIEITLIKPFNSIDFPQVLAELQDPNANGQFIKHSQVKWLEFECETSLPVNLDGEPYHNTNMHIEVVPHSLKLVLPENSPCLL